MVGRTERRAAAPYDLIVVGAGINGLGIARDAAERGLHVAIVEQEDLCSGVSAWSGRLVHGGLRYLEHGDIALVRESLRERERLFRLAPHLVKPVRLIMPFYARNRRPSWMIRLGMLAYDILSFDKSVAWHRILSESAVRRRFTGMAETGLSGAALFTDGQVEYAERLCVELAIAAAGAGADIITHTRVEDLVLEGGQVVGVRTVDDDGERAELRAAIVVNAAGPWVDTVAKDAAEGGSAPSSRAPRLIGGSKGSHIIVDPFPGAPTDVVYYESQSDGRLVLVIPWTGRYLIGCTDRLFDQDPDAARAESDEIDYLLTEANALMPDAGLTVDDVLYTYSGVRPLPYAPGIPEWRIPRSHIVYDHADTGRPGLYSIVGGKLTTYRQLAEDAVDTVMKRLGRRGRTVSKELPFPGARSADLEAFRTAFRRTSGLPTDTAERLLGLYGVRAARVAELATAEPGLGERFDPDSPAIAAELVMAVEEEFAQTLTDVFARRSLLAFEPSHGLRGAARAAEILGERLGWDADERRAQVAGYERWLDHLRVPAVEHVTG
ncbi:glycerol-3-phosphate dehydrogenase [Agromyces binzhouensis]|uniref:Glycerol-3-phosphate dehydrogenase n=1 Tax=Agromyces binzhouensis TaxID=1817495 RepID=A0A4Q2JW79_9MICO|nr:glycerol-3-phosphate dehydrogenase [Agromyces binzhouensis]RXZ51664.1 glycerol-3-phosphate dehydrogenase [Agromyces binzhouensis]